MNDWTKFIFKRLNELHPLIFGEKSPSLINSILYFSYSKEYNKLGYGRDYSKHPRNMLIL